MKSRFFVPAAMAGALLFGMPAAYGQPVTKLTTNLSQTTIDAIWCSALFLEEAYYWEEGSEDAVHYEGIAYDLGEQLDDVMREAGLPTAESEEVWEIFDAAAADFSLDDQDGFFEQLDHCEAAYLDNKIELR